MRNESNVKTSVLCNRLGIKSNVFCARFKQKGITVGKLNEMLKALDYKIVVVPCDANIDEQGFEIE